MPRKPAQKQAQKQDSDPFSASQASSQSDDFAHELIAAVEEKIRAKNSQKRKGTERKFLCTLESDLENSMNASKGVVKKLELRRTQVLERFALEYAIQDDAIRKVRVQMMEEHRSLVGILSQERVETASFMQEIESMQTRALAKIARGCQEDHEAALRFLDLAPDPN
ncbi:hypothetical protein BDV98DRAFT_572008 [Pterulicium gracile]|uniref:Uncharacterized protein n=1 Tax=Pterulicium gracile TaxID=1884261 RepID=A0A5C3QB42_9AGAR|nr:hypothetical protein BDV98DRAFT_572008 [Pterula gracilis]